MLQKLTEQLQVLFWLCQRPLQLITLNQWICSKSTMLQKLTEQLQVLFWLCQGPPVDDTEPVDLQQKHDASATDGSPAGALFAAQSAEWMMLTDQLQMFQPLQRRGAHLEVDPLFVVSE